MIFFLEYVAYDFAVIEIVIFIWINNSLSDSLVSLLFQMRGDHTTISIIKIQKSCLFSHCVFNCLY